ncbi:MAG: hypothetical protein NUV55_00045 [Sulfuricaulis sp.]|uniref:hypothetical protein n=1 Tax=Sulfuricaulis sp. TaxID=2003553 RepID=UPI0025DFB62E|nr:hypothetical protein [Sulfuricaulis sp.]MCR4345588.1 hypothetical protein [Sulfuricaulis sp.]
MKRLLLTALFLCPATLFAAAPLEILVPYQFSQLSPEVQQARINCGVYSTDNPPTGGYGAMASGLAMLSLIGKSSASGKATVKIAVPTNQTPRSYFCSMEFFNGKTWSIASTNSGANQWAKAGPGSVLSAKGKVPPRPSLPIPGQPTAIPGLNL